ncbi:tRNA dihydrouridine synthase A [Vavraia culicis subsp. floridensis]|uniref:tRNA dihydrouridine synthase A n=1 Tax=Vavraia culicis (isolate floridensis) TaxID=948595 RepID=L2GVL5_VAVCU|nr:tRNA dihydrouridine synthase A [Vavraia culicis subsp. floridensis]ELA47679.1 tRNA dihydrouridine synthase A [Vavraia culicis subsp. floridensis]
MILSLAPMLKVTTPQFRSLIRIISSDVYLFTEMLSAEYILNNDGYQTRIGTYDPLTIIQLGGNNPKKISLAVLKVIKQTNFRMFNLNLGCPSPKVTQGQFGASLMLDVQLVIDIINEVYNVANTVLSVKCRIGVDENDTFAFFHKFVEKVAGNTKCRDFYVHARKCWLKGLSPKENRNIPMLNYEFVRALKRMMPCLKVHLNGGVKSLDDGDGLDGVMLGRAAVKNVFVFEDIRIRGKIACGDDKSPVGEDCACQDYLSDVNTDSANLKTCHGTEEGEKNEVEQSDSLSSTNESNGSEGQIDYYHIIKTYLDTLDQNKSIKSCDVVPLMNIFRGKRGTKCFKTLLSMLVGRKVAVSACKDEIMQCVKNVLNQ